MEDGVKNIIRFVDVVQDQIDGLLGKHDWKRSKLLIAYAKELQSLKDQSLLFHKNLLQEIAQDTQMSEQLASGITSSIVVGDQNAQKIYVNMYQSTGSRLEIWERLIVGINMSSFGRPIYAQEDQVKQLIASKENLANEGYVIVLVNNEDIIKGQTTTDSLGNKMLYIKQGQIKSQNVLGFVHANSVYYQFQEKRLVRGKQIDQKK
jgi:intracellular multiplication protein IcmQ